MLDTRLVGKATLDETKRSEMIEKNILNYVRTKVLTFIKSNKLDVSLDVYVTMTTVHVIFSPKVRQMRGVETMLEECVVDSIRTFMLDEFAHTVWKRYRHEGLGKPRVRANGRFKCTQYGWRIEEVR